MLKIKNMAITGGAQKRGKTRQVLPETADLRRRLIASPLLALALAAAASAAVLQSGTSAVFDRYVKLTQAGFEAQNSGKPPFLWFENMPANRSAEIERDLQSGQVVIEKLETTDSGRPISVPDGMIHHWIGTVFIPGATLAQVLAFEEDYDHQASFFQPDVISSKILQHTGPDFAVNLRFYKKKAISVVLDTDHQVHYASIDANRAWSESWTTRVQQVDHPGQPGEKLQPQGRDDGFLWRMNTYWRFEAKDGGVYVESQSVSLTRDIPTGLGWMVGPFVTSIPRQSLDFTLANTRKAVLQRIGRATK